MESVSLFGLAAAGLALSIAGCAAPASAEDDATSATSEAAYSSGTWTKVATCNGGAAVLDVDTGDRRNVQLVIRDRAAVDYLQSRSASPMVNARHEIVVQSGEPVMHGIFKASDFGADDFWSYRVPDFYNAAIVQRAGAGIKVTIAKRFNPVCEGGQWGYQGGCWGGHTIRAQVQEELANWYFDDCR
jgi:hypothetical protein